jgi:hypothetical protein
LVVGKIKTPNSLEKVVIFFANYNMNNALLVLAIITPIAQFAYIQYKSNKNIEEHNKRFIEFFTSRLKN